MSEQNFKTDYQEVAKQIQEILKVSKQGLESLLELSSEAKRIVSNTASDMTSSVQKEADKTNTTLTEVKKSITDHLKTIAKEYAKLPTETKDKTKESMENIAVFIANTADAIDIFGNRVGATSQVMLTSFSTGADKLKEGMKGATDATKDASKISAVFKSNLASLGIEIAVIALSYFVTELGKFIEKQRLSNDAVYRSQKELKQAREEMEKLDVAQKEYIQNHSSDIIALQGYWDELNQLVDENGDFLESDKDKWTSF